MLITYMEKDLLWKYQQTIDDSCPAEEGSAMELKEAGNAKVVAIIWLV